MRTTRKITLGKIHYSGVYNRTRGTLKWVAIYFVVGRSDARLLCAPVLFVAGLGFSQQPKGAVWLLLLMAAVVPKIVAVRTHVGVCLCVMYTFEEPFVEMLVVLVDVLFFYLCFASAVPRSYRIRHENGERLDRNCLRGRPIVAPSHGDSR